MTLLQYASGLWQEKAATLKTIKTGVEHGGHFHHSLSRSIGLSDFGAVRISPWWRWPVVPRTDVADTMAGIYLLRKHIKSMDNLNRSTTFPCQENKQGYTPILNTLIVGYHHSTADDIARNSSFGMSDDDGILQKKVDDLKKGECLRITGYNIETREYVTELTSAPNIYVRALEICISQGIPWALIALKFDALVLTGVKSIVQNGIDTLDFSCLRPFTELHIKGDCAGLKQVNILKGTEVIADLQGEWDVWENYSVHSGFSAQWLTIKIVNGLSTPQFTSQSGVSINELNDFKLDQGGDVYNETLCNQDPPYCGTLLKRFDSPMTDPIATVESQTPEKEGWNTK